MWPGGSDGLVTFTEAGVGRISQVSEKNRSLCLETFEARRRVRKKRELGEKQRKNAHRNS